MSNKKIFSEEIELSEIVLNKTNQAFEMIKQEDTGYMEKSNMRGKKVLKTQAAAIVAICLLGISSISAVAAVHHYWGRGMNGNIQATDTQQQVLTEEGVAEVYQENPNDSSMAVTDNGVIITPDTVVVDDRYAYLSFCISNYSVDDGAEPGFEMIEVYQGDNPEDDNSWVNMSGTMYNGIIMDENGRPVYEDGSSLEYYEDGSMICHYNDENGNMEYIIQASVADENDSLLGKTLHVNFKNLGTLSKADFTPVVEGDWNFEISLSDVSSTQEIEVGKKIEGTGFEIEKIDISPISIKVNYSVSEQPEKKEDDLGIPEVKGVVLKDGTKIPYLIGGSMTGYTDSTETSAYQIAGFKRVIDVDEIKAFIVFTPHENEKIEIPISK